MMIVRPNFGPHTELGRYRSGPRDPEREMRSITSSSKRWKIGDRDGGYEDRGEVEKNPRLIHYRKRSMGTRKNT